MSEERHDLLVQFSVVIIYGWNNFAGRWNPVGKTVKLYNRTLKDHFGQICRPCFNF